MKKEKNGLLSQSFEGGGRTDTGGVGPHFVVVEGGVLETSSGRSNSGGFHDTELVVGHIVSRVLDPELESGWKFSLEVVKDSESKV